MTKKYELSFVASTTLIEVEELIQKELTKTKKDQKNVFDILSSKLSADEIVITDITLKHCNYSKIKKTFGRFKSVFEYFFEYTLSHNINNLDFVIGSVFFLFFIYITIKYLNLV